MTSVLARAAATVLVLLPSRNDIRCYLRGKRHEWTDMTVPIKCANCGVNQIIPRDVFDFGD